MQRVITGTMHVRATEKGTEFFTSWLLRILEHNCLNDQRVVNFEHVKNGTRTSNCDINTYRETSGDSTFTSAAYKYLPGSETDGIFRYCFLNEFVFQNGLMEFYCSKGKRGSSMSAYALGMKHKGLNYHNSTKDIVTTSEVNSLPIHTSLLYTAATLHVNFCVTKKKGLEERGLWLYHHSLSANNTVVEKCMPYNVYKTHYALANNWTEKISTGEVELTAAVQSMKSSELIKFPRDGTVYLFENSSLHLIPNKDTFLGRGYDFDQVKTLKNTIYWLLPYGEDLPSLAATKT